MERRQPVNGEARERIDELAAAWEATAMRLWLMLSVVSFFLLASMAGIYYLVQENGDRAHESERLGRENRGLLREVQRSRLAVITDACGRDNEIRRILQLIPPPNYPRLQQPEVREALARENCAEKAREAIRPLPHVSDGEE